MPVRPPAVVLEPPDADVAIVEARVEPSETGHMLRHTCSNIAKLEGIDEVDRELLLAHTVPGVKGTYLFKPVLFGRLLEEQRR